MNKILSSSCFLLVSFLFIGCNYRIQKNTPAAVTEFVFSSGDEISFALVNEHVLASSCLQCHSPNGARMQNAGDVNLVGYQNVFSHRGDIRHDIMDASMPKDSVPLSVYQKRLILAWLDAGANENPRLGSHGDAPNPSPIPPALPVEVPDFTEDEIYYDVVNKYVFATNCTKCHSGKPGSKRIDWTTYQGIVSNLDEINEQLDMGQMPPPPPKGKPLSAAQFKLLYSWINRGLPEKPETQ